MTTIQSLGRVGVVYQGAPTELSASQRRIIAVLIAAGPAGLSDEHLAEELWGDVIPDGWKANIRQAISRMRRALPAEAITSGGRHYALALPPHEIDVWQLLNHTTIDLTDTAQLGDDQLRSRLTDDPYPAAADGTAVRNSIQAITGARIELLDRLRTEAPQRATATLRAATHKLALSTWNEDLVRAVVDLHIAVGEPATALDLLSKAIDRIEGEIGPVGAKLHERHVELATQPQTADERAGTVSVAPTRWLGNPPWESQTSLLERDRLNHELTEHLTAGRSVLITGDSGTGKTLLTQRLAESRHDAGRGSHIVWLVSQRATAAAYAPILSVFPQLIDVLNATDTADESLVETRRWTAIQQHIRNACPHAPITLIVDDAQWLDSQTAQFIEFWARSTHPDGVELVIVGRDDSAENADWAAMSNRLQRSGLALIAVEQFSHIQLVDLIGLHHPSSTSRQRADMAELLIDEGAALPARASDLIAMADATTLRLPPRTGAEQPWADTVWTSAVGPTTADIAGTAALIGVSWSFGQLLQYIALDADALADAVDELLDADLIVARSRPDQFSFRHVLVQEAFASTVSSRDAREFHTHAASLALANGRVHERARHLLAVGSSVDLSALFEALVASGDAHLHARSFLEAVHAYEAADRVQPAAFTPAALARYTHAIERSGSNARTLRARAFEAARVADDAELMLHVLVDGADPGELLESEPERSDLLSQVPRDRLSPADQLRLDATRCRELALAGHLDHAVAAHAHMHLTSPDDHATGWLALWGFFVGSPPSSWPELGVATDDIDDNISRSRVRNVNCARQLMLGDRAGFDNELTALAAEPASNEHPVRRWHLHLLQSLQATLDGNRQRAEAIASAGFDIGQQYGLAGAFPARTAQVFAEHWVRSRHGDLVPILDLSAPDVADSLLATAARASALFTLDERLDDALALTDQIVVRLDERTQAVHAPVAVLLAGAAQHLSESTRARVRNILGPFAGHAVLASASIAHLGPAHRALGLLADNEATRLELLQRAVGEADEWSMPLWSVRCRLDLAIATNDDRYHDEARRIANERGGELTTMFFS